MDHSDATLEVLHRLIVRIHTYQVADENTQAPGYTSLIDVADDLGRWFVAPQAAPLRDMLATLAAGREALERSYPPEGGFKTPWDVLRREKEGAPYAAGALWALSACLDSLVRELDSLDEGRSGRSRRAVCREVALNLAGSQEVIRPAEVLRALQRQGLETDRTTVSHAIADLIKSGDLEPAPWPEGAERRHRFYRKTAQAA